MTVPTNIKKVGCCSFCNKAVFDILTQYPANTPFAGLPIRIGAPHDDAWRTAILLTDGTVADFTFCTECLPSVEDRLPELWRKAIASFVFENENRVALGGSPVSPKHHDKIREMVAGFTDNVPLGILHVFPWIDYVEGRVGG